MNIIGIYPVSSQPPHLGHYRAYEYLKKLTGVNTFVATSNKVELPQAPLTFEDKQQIWTKHGVPIDKVIMAKNPYKAVEITQKFGRDRTVAIFAMKKQEADNALKTANGYFLPFKSTQSATEPLSKHAYILPLPDSILSLPTTIGSLTIRQAFGSKRLSEEQKKSFFKQVFGWYDISLFELISKKFAEANTVKERINESMDVIRRTLTPFIKKMVKELVQPQGDSTITTPTDPNVVVPSPADAAKAAREKEKADTLKLKDLQKQRELRLKKQKTDADQSKLDVKNLDAQIKATKLA
jgi:hypothetical protein